MRSSVGGLPPWRDSLSVWTLRWGRNPALWGGHGHRWGSVAHVQCRVWSRSWVAAQARPGRVWITLFKNRSVFMLTHNDWFHWAPRIITKGFPLLNGNYKRQIDSKQLTSWVKQLSLPLQLWVVMPPWVGMFISVVSTQNTEINSQKVTDFKNEWRRE